MHVRCQRALATAQLTIMAIQALAGLPSSQQLVHEPWHTTSSPSSELHNVQLHNPHLGTQCQRLPSSQLPVAHLHALAAPAPLGCVLCVVFYKALNQRPALAPASAAAAAAAAAASRLAQRSVLAVASRPERSCQPRRAAPQNKG
jgi:hypothetical protein